MPNSFNGYCYSSITEAAAAEISLPVFSANVGVAVSTSFSAVTANTGNLTVTYKPFSNTAVSSYVLTRTYPSCTDVGYLTNYTGLDLLDAVTVSWLVVLCWAMAFGVKTIRRAL